jgi:GH18 family chitinase
MIAIGGWGDTEGFSKAAATVSSRKLFAKNVKAMVDRTRADGTCKVSSPTNGADVIRCRYRLGVSWVRSSPKIQTVCLSISSGNGEDYKQVPNSEKAWEIKAYPKLLAEIRSALGPRKLISAAVPGLRRDMLAFTKTTIPEIDASLDFFNIMTYDLMNRRDNVTKHHTGIELSLDSINAYLASGVPPEKANLGFAFYVKWFKTDPHGGCKRNPIGCKTALMEDPVTGGDLGQAGQFAWCDDVPSELEKSFKKALKDAMWDDVQGGNYYFDIEENLFWSWDEPYVISKKIPLIVEGKKLGGVFSWGLGEDGTKWEHLKALTAGVLEHKMKLDPRIKDEL